MSSANGTSSSIQLLKAELESTRSELTRIRDDVSCKAQDIADLKAEIANGKSLDPKMLGVLVTVVLAAFTGIWSLVGQSESRVASEVKAVEIRTAAAASSAKSAASNAEIRATKEVEQLRSETQREMLDLRQGARSHQGSETGHNAVLRLVSEVKFLKDELNQVRHKFDQHQKEPEHPGALVTRENLQALKDRFDRIEPKVDDAVKNIGYTQRAHDFISELKSRISSAETKSTHNERNIATVAASASSGLIEVESQLRGMTATNNTHSSWQDAMLVALGHAVKGLGGTIEIDLNSIYRSDNIPASASTSIGEIKTNGGSK